MPLPPIWKNRSKEEIIVAMQKKFVDLGGAAFFGNSYGPPAPCPQPNKDSQNWFWNFEKGSIFHVRGAGAVEIHGQIRNRWAAMDYERSPLGFPVRSVRDVGDGKGQFTPFSKGGAIYWSPSTGAHAVYGAIYQTWMKLGGPRSWLGYPTSDEFSKNGSLGSRFSLFERGEIAWSPRDGANPSRSSFKRSANPGAVSPQAEGFESPSSDEPIIRRVLQTESWMKITDHESFGDNETKTSQAPTRSLVLYSGKKTGLQSWEAYCGGEVRVEVHLEALLRSDGWIEVSGKIELFEGISEQTTDLDGSIDVDYMIPPDDKGTVRQDVTVRNTAEGGDFANVTLVFTNSSTLK